MTGGHLNFNSDFEIFQAKSAQMQKMPSYEIIMQLRHEISQKLGRNSSSPHFTMIKTMYRNTSQDWTICYSMWKFLIAMVTMAT